MANLVQNILDEVRLLKLSQVFELIEAMEREFQLPGNGFVASPFQSMSILEKIETAPVLQAKTTVDVILSSVPSEKKIAILKIVRNVTGLGLKESKDLVDNVPKLLKQTVTKSEAEVIKSEIEALGGIISIV